MQVVSSTELLWLILTVLMTALFWLPYILNRIVERGVGPALWDPQGHTEANANWAERMQRAHTNAVENLVIFVPLVLTLAVVGISSESTILACQVYFFARLAHFVLFTFGVPVLRILAFLVGFYAQMVLAITLLKHLFN